MKNALLAATTLALIATPAFSQTGYAESAAAMYDRAPDIASCDAGVLYESERQSVLDLINDIRAHHGLAAVSYASEWDASVMEASLATAASGRLSHQIDAGWACHSASATEGAAASNLSGGVQSPYLTFETNADVIIGWLTDAQNAVPDNIGHRRWMLDPFLSSVAYGRVATVLPNGSATDGAALRVIGQSAPATTTEQPFIAYPVGDYPSAWFDPRAFLSFGVVADPSNKWANRSVDLSAAQVSIRSADGSTIPVGRISADNQGFGLPNSMHFRAEGIQADVEYAVSIRGVRVGGETRSYDYRFRIVP